MLGKGLVSTLTGITVGLGMGCGAMAATWDMPTSYPDKIYHTLNSAAFERM